MLSAYSLSSGQLSPCASSDGVERAVWVDLLEPSHEEERQVEQSTGLAVPTREEMAEIEISNRLYEEDGASFATVSLLVGASADKPALTPVTFILKGERLLTVRYSPVRAFEAFTLQACRPVGQRFSGAVAVLLGLMEAVVNRLADTLEQSGVSLDIMAQNIFEEESRFRRAEVRDFRNVLRRLGRKGDMLSKARESLVSLGRMTAFLSAIIEADGAHKENRTRLKSIGRDIAALTDHVSYLTGRISLLLDATLGLINMEQNGIIKIFSVAAVIFLPPTLVASIYGMNFEHMPELRWMLGYPFALIMMVAAAVLPYVYFKRKGWL